MNLDTPSIADFPDELGRLEEWRRRRALSDERERAVRLMARYEEGLELSEEEWVILSFTPRPYGLGSACGY